MPPTKPASTSPSPSSLHHRSPSASASALHAGVFASSLSPSEGERGPFSRPLPISIAGEKLSRNRSIHFQIWVEPAKRGCFSATFAQLARANQMTVQMHGRRFSLSPWDHGSRNVRLLPGNHLVAVLGSH